MGRESATSSKGASNDGFSVSPPPLTLPKGGGAIRGIGEKFGANPVTGTGSMSVPIATSPGRSGFGPQLSLSYDSGTGNGPFGFGWSLSLPTITRKTDKGLPRYLDASESDVFVLSGAEDLVPVLEKEKQSDKWARKNLPLRTRHGHTYAVALFRPRTEGLFARIERWTSTTDATDVFWRSITRDNIATFYGTTSGSRIADPRDPGRIFSWLICESYDDKGNAISYEYAPEKGAGVPMAQAHERNRTRTANRYLKRILHGNRERMYRAALPPADPRWMFETVFDYGEGHTAPIPVTDGEHQRVQLTEPEPPADAWGLRQDAFSTFRGGFELRTYRLCRRVLMLHRFAEELGVERCLVRSTDFLYKETPIASFITSVVQSGFRRDGETYIKRSMPPLELEYSEATIDATVHDVPLDSLEHLPAGLGTPEYELVDLDAEGAPGILSRQTGGWFHKRNLSPSTLTSTPGGHVDAEAVFAPVEVVASQPAAGPEDADRQFLDLAGDGQVDLVDFAGTVPGFYERTPEEGWEPFFPFTSLPSLDWSDPNLKFVDLTGDGHADVLVSEDDAFTWYASLGELGFGASERVAKALDEEDGPRLVFADGTQSVYLADMSGDGLTDLVRIRNGEVCYWPNLGYARFGPKVTMDNAPWFDTSDLFSQSRVRLADIDGSGVTDIIYLASGGVRLYFNQSGNSWSAAHTLEAFPGTENPSAVQTADLLGTGTACLVWSSPLPGDARQPMRYVDLMGGQKPHLLVRTVNNLGAETHVHYAPSTKFYLLDKRAGIPWITRPPFPVHVVEQVETTDRIGRSRFVTRYTYRHGFFDGVEREFRGFGLVEQRDTEAFTVLGGADALETVNIDAASHVPPVLTRTWFHTGVYVGRDRVSAVFSGIGKDTGEYYREPGSDDDNARTRLLEDTILPPGLSAEEEREACRALKGSMLRQEVYALDGTGTPDYPYGHPYTVSEQNFTIELAQPRAGNRHAVFFVHPREAISSHYERRPQDPRVSHAITLDVDRFGDVVKSLAIAYGRREADPGLSPADRVKQTDLFITYAQTDFTDPVDQPVEQPDDYRAPLPASARTYELTGFAPDGLVGRFSFDQWAKNDFEELTTAVEIPYEVAADPGVKQKRVIEHVRTRYRRNNLTGLLPQGGLESLALPGESYKLALTPGLLTRVFRRAVADGLDELLLPDPAAVLGGKGEDQGGYVDLDSNGHWWVPSGQVFYDPNGNVSDPASTATAESVEAAAHFFLPRKFVDPFGQSATVEYDTHHLLAVTTEDAVGNVVAARHDYRVLQPAEVTDPNGNRSQVMFDAFGLVAGTVVMGKVGEDRGDTADGFDAELTLAQSNALLDGDDPQIVAHTLLGGATARVVYDTGRFQRTRQAHPDTPADWEPVYAVSLARETHVRDLQDGQPTRIQIGFSYSDGFGREIQKKVQAEPGPILPGGPDVSLRWVGSGWTIFNNKGKPVRQYEPFFSQLPARRHRFEFGLQAGVSPILFYDPVERVVATLHPNHTWEKVVFDAWRQETWDVNDTVTLDPADDDVMKGFVLEPDGSPRLPAQEYLPTWHGLRTDPDHALAAEQKWPDPASRGAERHAAENAAVHAATPTVTHFDALGRAFLTVAHNRLRRSHTPPADPATEAFYSTRVTFDIEGNQREVSDAKDRVVMRYDYDMLGHRLHQASMDAGARWMLLDVAGKPIRTWDDRRFIRRMTYDVLRRPTGLFVSSDGAPESLAGKTEYGESKPGAAATNHRARVWRVSDGAGTLISEQYDFKGNLLHSVRRLLADYKNQVNWALEPTLEGEQFSTRTVCDALNRPVQMVAPHSDLPGTLISVVQPLYNESNLLEQVHAWLNQDVKPSGLLNPSTATLHAVTDIDYDAKGQRTLIEYGNGVRTTYLYDPETFRLSRLVTRRNQTLFPDDCPQPAPTGWPGCQVQNLHYTYDPVGNIAHIRDESQQTIYFRNTRVDPNAEYAYDAIYRLIEATGREHLGQLNGGLQPPIPASHTDIPRVGQLHPGDGNAMGNYRELYDYDAVGNIDRIRHVSASGAWTRTYAYSVASGQESNRLVSSIVGETTEAFTHDVHGNMTSMPHLARMAWDFEDQLQSVDLGGGGAVYFTYDAAGQRVRKVWEKSQNIVDEHIYLGGFEVFRRRTAAGAVALERETLHLMDVKRRIALVETTTIDIGHTSGPTTVTRYQGGNHLGSASLEMDDQAHVLSYEEYYPYGSTSYQAARTGVEVSAKRYRHNGKERDEDTGFSYNTARYYAPWLCRWTAADPAGLADGPNPYVYARGAPVIFTDPSGTRPPTEQDDRHQVVPEQRGQPTNLGEFASGVVGSIVVGAVELFAGGSEASAPTTAEEARSAPKSEKVEAQLTKLVVTMTALRLVGVVGKVVMPEATVGSVMVRGGLQGSAAAVGYTAASDVTGGTQTPPKDYAKAAAAGFVIGAAISGAGHAARRGTASVKQRLLEKEYQKAVVRTGDPVLVDTNRPAEWPYHKPPEMHIAGPGTQLKLSDLDTGKKYLWVVDKSGRVLVAAEQQAGFGSEGGPRLVKHGDLVPGPGGQSRGAARAGGELQFDQAQGKWVMNNDSSYTFARKTGPHGTPENLEAAKDLLKLTGTDTSQIVTKDVLAGLR